MHRSKSNSKSVYRELNLLTLNQELRSLQNSSCGGNKGSAVLGFEGEKTLYGKNITKTDSTSKPERSYALNKMSSPVKLNDLIAHHSQMYAACDLLYISTVQLRDA